MCYRDVLGPACERRGVDLSRVEVLDSSSTPLSLLTTDASTLGGKHLRVIGEITLFHMHANANSDSILGFD